MNKRIRDYSKGFWENEKLRSVVRLLRRSLFAFLLLYCSVALSQTRRIDSLQSLLQTNIHDTIRINTLNALAWELRISKPDSCLDLSNAALNLAVQIPYERGMSTAYHNMGVVNKRIGNFNNALDFFREEEKIRKALCDKIMDSEISSDDVAKQQGKCKQSFAIIYTHIGLIYWAKGNYPKAFKWTLEAVRLYEELGNSTDAKLAKSSKRGLATFSNNVGNIYYSQGDYRQAMDHYIKSLELQEELHNKRGVATACNNIGVIHEVQANLVEAMKWYDRAVEIDEEDGNERRLVRDYASVGLLYSSMADAALTVERKDSLLRQAMIFLQKSLTIANKIGHVKGMAHIQTGIAGILGKTNLYVEAIAWYNKAVVLADSIGQKERLMVAYKGLTNMNFRLGEVGAETQGLVRGGKTKEYYKEAFVYHKLYSQVKDSLFNEEKSKDLGKLEAKHEYETAEAERKRLEIEELGLENEKINRRNSLQYSAIVIGLMVIGLLVYWLLFLRASICQYGWWRDLYSCLSCCSSSLRSFFSIHTSNPTPAVGQSTS